MHLLLRPEVLVICRLPAQSPWPSAPSDGSLFSVTTDGEELSVVCRTDLAPPEAIIEPDWRAITVAGPLDFALVGIVADLARVLAAEAISLFVLSTYDTDHVLVKATDLRATRDALAGAGHTVSDLPDSTPPVSD